MDRLDPPDRNPLRDVLAATGRAQEDDLAAQADAAFAQREASERAATERASLEDARTILKWFLPRMRKSGSPMSLRFRGGPAKWWSTPKLFPGWIIAQHGFGGVYVVSGSYSQQAIIAVMLSGRLWRVSLDPTYIPPSALELNLGEWDTAKKVANRAKRYGHGELVQQITSDDDLIGGSFSACDPVTRYPLDPIPYDEQVAQYDKYLEKLIAHPVTGPETPIAIHPESRLPADGGSTFYWAVVRSVGEILARMPADQP